MSDSDGPVGRLRRRSRVDATVLRLLSTLTFRVGPVFFTYLLPPSLAPSLHLCLSVLSPSPSRTERDHPAPSGVRPAGFHPRGRPRPAELLHHVPHRQAAQDEALQALQQLRAHVRPPLPLVRDMVLTVPLSLSSSSSLLLSLLLSLLSSSLLLLFLLFFLFLFYHVCPFLVSGVCGHKN